MKTKTNLTAYPRWVQFWARVDSVNSPTGCWLWMGSRTPAGYGQFSKRVDGCKKHEMAHRVAYELATGPIPDGLLVRHKCDNPRCVNPKHLELGTQSDNMLDAYRRGRRPDIALKGERNPGAKLTAALVVQIRERAERGEAQTALAAVFGVSQAVISDVVLKKRWLEVMP